MNRYAQLFIFAVVLTAGPALSECNSAPIANNHKLEAFDETVEVDVLSTASDSQGHPLIISAVSTTCDATVTVNFDLLELDPDPAIRSDCSVSFTIADELGSTDTGTVTVTVIAGIFSDSFEQGSTAAWSDAVP